MRGGRDRVEERLAAVFDLAAPPDAETAELREVARRLERAGEVELDALLREGADPALEAAARERLRTVMAAGARRDRRGAWLGIAALAAAAVLLWLGLRTGRGTPGPRPNPSLGEGRLVLEAPRGAVEAYGTFRWSGLDLPPGAAWHLRIRAADAAPGSKPWLERVVEQPRWTPPDEDALPPAIRWEVEAVGANGEPLGWTEQLASRSSH